MRHVGHHYQTTGGYIIYTNTLYYDISVYVRDLQDITTKQQVGTLYTNTLYYDISVYVRDLQDTTIKLQVSTLYINTLYYDTCFSRYIHRSIWSCYGGLN